MSVRLSRQLIEVLSAACLTTRSSACQGACRYHLSPTAGMRHLVQSTKETIVCPGTMFEKRVRMTAAAFGQFPFPCVGLARSSLTRIRPDQLVRWMMVMMMMMMMCPAGRQPWRPGSQGRMSGGAVPVVSACCAGAGAAAACCRYTVACHHCCYGSPPSPSVTAAAAAPVGGEPEPRDGLRATQFNVIARRGQSRTVASDVRHMREKNRAHTIWQSGPLPWLGIQYLYRCARQTVGMPPSPSWAVYHPQAVASRLLPQVIPQILPTAKPKGSK